MNFIKTFLAALLAFVLGSLAILLFGMFILFAIAGSMERTVTVKEGSILRIDFSEVINDAPSSDPLAGFDFRTLQSTRQLSLLKVLRTLEAAAADDRIEGIYLRMNGMGGVTGTALIEELREAIELFKQSGKFVVSYNETYSQGQYYLASAADRIYLQPEGGMDWSGLSTSLMFYKGLFDKLDLKAEVFRPTVCKYKSAVEPYILDRMSEANREQMQALVDSMWGTIAEAVAASRGIDVERLNEIADKLQDFGVLVLGKPFTAVQFRQAVQIAASNYKRLAVLRAENAKLLDKIAQLRLVDRAKCYLIEKKGMTETEAHRLIEKGAMDTRRSRGEVAQEILEAEEEE